MWSRNGGRALLLVGAILVSSHWIGTAAATAIGLTVGMALVSRPSRGAC